jgi:hypothetical protein
MLNGKVRHIALEIALRKIIGDPNFKLKPVELVIDQCAAEKASYMLCRNITLEELNDETI